MNKVTIPTVDGYDVYVDTYQQAWTYAGLLAGRPNKYLNAGIIYQRLKGLEATWGDKRTIFINKKYYEMEELPRIMCAAWLVCDKLIPGKDPDCFGSHCFLVWFQDESDLPPSQAVMQGLGDKAWAELAENYDI